MNHTSLFSQTLPRFRFLGNFDWLSTSGVDDFFNLKGKKIISLGFSGPKISVATTSWAV